MRSLRLFLQIHSIHLVTYLVLAICPMWVACATDIEPASDHDHGGNGLDGQGKTPDGSLHDWNSFDVHELPAFFASIHMSMCAADEGQADALVRIVDEAGDPVSGVIVHGMVSGESRVALSTTTDTQGLAIFRVSRYAGFEPDAFQVVAVGYEVEGEMMYVLPQSTMALAGCLADGLTDRQVYEAFGMSTSTGVEEGETGTEVTANGMSTSTGVEEGEIGTEVTANGMSTSTGVEEEPGTGDTGTAVTANGMSTSTGVEEEPGTGDTGTAVTANGMSTSTGVEEEPGTGDTGTAVTANGMSTSTGVEEEPGTATETATDGMSTSTGAPESE